LTEKERWQVIANHPGKWVPAFFFSLLVITVPPAHYRAWRRRQGRLFSPLAYYQTYAMAAAAILTITGAGVGGYFVRGKIIPD